MDTAIGIGKKNGQVTFSDYEVCKEAAHLLLLGGVGQAEALGDLACNCARRVHSSSSGWTHC